MHHPILGYVGTSSELGDACLSLSYKDFMSIQRHFVFIVAKPAKAVLITYQT